MSAILGIMTALAVLFGGFRLLNAEPVVYLFFGVQTLVICLVKMFNTRMPRAASAIAGALMAPLFTVPRGQTCQLALRNETAWWHPMHLHGHSFRVLMRNGAAVPQREWRDTLLMPPRSRAEVAFVAEQPGDWMFHCHVTDHQMSGLMAVIGIT